MIAEVVEKFCHRDIISIDDFSKDEILQILRYAKMLEETPSPELLQGCILANCFFEPSTRTRLSFESAMLRLGGQAMGFTDAGSTSQRKGESLHDTLKMVEHYADVIVIRHPHEGAAQWAADVVDIPVINAGDGSNQHPTQTLLDLFSILETQGRLDNLSIAMAGDLKHGRTAHSLAQAFVHFNPRLYFVAPPTLEMPKGVCDSLRERGVKFSFHSTIDEVLPKVDILYMTRIQEERFADKMEYDSLKNSFCLEADMLSPCKETMKILHPLPRVKEIHSSVDKTPFAYYFEQAGNGVSVRKALLSLILGRVS